MINRTSFFLLITFLLTTTLLQAQSKRVVVAQDGSGQYTTVQAALDAIAKNNKKPWIIFIKKGVYKEKLLLDSTKNFVALTGEDKFNTVLAYDDHTGKKDAQGRTINTQTSASFLRQANNFSATNLTFQNDAGFTAGQAVAIQVNGDKAAFDNCRFVGNQDVLFTNNPTSRQYYKNCYIEGTTDFIFGSSSVWFEGCHIHSKKNSHVTAASTPQEHPYGYVFYDCMLTGDTSLHTVSLGRPWRPYASVTYIHCYIGPHILPAGWNNWNNNTANEATARYAEYQNYGPGAQPETRVQWSRQLSDDEIKKYTKENVLGNWNPIVK